MLSAGRNDRGEADHELLHIAQRPELKEMVRCLPSNDEEEDDDDDDDDDDDMNHVRAMDHHQPDEEDEEDEDTRFLNHCTVCKLDRTLLPFLALLFLLNSLDKSNIGNAETAGFTHDTDLTPQDLNYSLAAFFAVFVALQPVGAALGRKYGMARWVPACMSLWGLSTLLHIFVRKRWQLICLRVAIAALESGFYPTTVSYLSLFYTKGEFAQRLGVFYGQTAMAGVLGGLLSWAVFSQFPESGGSGPTLPPGEVVVLAERAEGSGWKSWEVLFVIEGCATMTIALVGFFWLPSSANTAWFLTPREKVWAEERIRLDRDTSNKRPGARTPDHGITVDEDDGEQQHPAPNDYTIDEAHHRLLADPEATRHRRNRRTSTTSLTADSGLTRHDIASALLNFKIWHLLLCNILSAMPSTAFGVFLPMVIKQFSPSLHLSPAASNLLAAPPFAFGALVLFIFTRWSDRSHQRLAPILWGLTLLILGLTLTVLVPVSNYVLRYISLCILLSGSFIASPLTVAWLSDNTPEPGKRAILLGINGWGNLAGVFSALLFTPSDKASAYIRPFIITLVCVLAAFIGFVAFWGLLARENRWREEVTKKWRHDEREREEVRGDVALPTRVGKSAWEAIGVEKVLRKMGLERGEGRRRGDEKITFRYGL